MRRRHRVLDNALQLLVTTDQRVDLADQDLGVEIGGVALERAALFGRFDFRLDRLFLARRCRILTHAVRDEVHHVKAG